MQGVGSRRPLLLCPRGVPPAHGCVPVRLCGCVPVRWLLSRRPGCAASAGGVAWWLGFAVVAGGMSLVSLWRGSCSTCLRVFVVVVWLVFVGGLGGIATIGAALRRVVGVSGVYGRKTPRVVACKGQRRVPVEGSMVVNLPRGCSKCSPPRWNAGDMGCLGCSGLRFGRGGWGDGGVVARLCAGGPFRWQCGRRARSATCGVNVRVKGPGQPPAARGTPGLI